MNKILESLHASLEQQNKPQSLLRYMECIEFC